MLKFLSKKFLVMGFLFAIGLCMNSISAYAFVDDCQLRPVTEVFEEIGATVTYKYPEDTLTVEKDGQVAIMTLRSRLIYRNEKYYTLDREVVVYEDRAYVSPDAIAKAFGEIPERVVDPTRPMVCLTFDDGPYSPVTDSILDVLEAYNSKATFFVVGNMIWQYPQTLKRASDLGMELGNHTYYHPRLSKCTWDQVVNEIAMTNFDSKTVTGDDLKIMRSPYGDSNNTVRLAVGMPIIKWSLDTLDWKNQDSNIIYHSVLDNVKDGDIVLMHDLLEPTRVAMWCMVPALLELGYQVVTVEEMIKARCWEYCIGTEYFCIF